MNEIPDGTVTFLRESGLILTLWFAGQHWIASIVNDERTEETLGGGSTIAEAVQDVYTNRMIGEFITNEIRKAL